MFLRLTIIFGRAGLSVISISQDLALFGKQPAPISYLLEHFKTHVERHPDSGAYSKCLAGVSELCHSSTSSLSLWHVDMWGFSAGKALLTEPGQLHTLPAAGPGSELESWWGAWDLNITPLSAVKVLIQFGGRGSWEKGTSWHWPNISS